MFMVDDNSPPSHRNVSRLEPRCSDGRNLSAIKRTNYVRGGHRLDPDTPSSKGSLQDKSNQELAFLFGSGKSASEHGRPKSDLYTSYCKGEGKADFAWPGKSKTEGDKASSAGKSAQPSYGESK